MNAERWDALTEAQQYEARELAFVYRRSKEGLPNYTWIREHSEMVAEMPYRTFIAFSRAILDACKAVQ